MLDNVTCDGEQRRVFCTCEHSQGKKHPLPKNHPQPSAKLPKIL